MDVVFTELSRINPKFNSLCIQLKRLLCETFIEDSSLFGFVTWEISTEFGEYDMHLQEQLLCEQDIVQRVAKRKSNVACFNMIGAELEDSDVVAHYNIEQQIKRFK